MQNETQPTAAQHPPHLPAIEMAVLGAVMLSTGALDKIASIFGPRLFYVPANAAVAEAICQLHNEAKPVDVLTVAHQLRANGTLDATDSVAYLCELTASVTGDSNLAYHAGLLDDYAAKRAAIEIGRKLTQDGATPGTDTYAIITEAGENLGRVGILSRGPEPAPMSKMAIEVGTALTQAAENPDLARGIRTGLETLDAVTTGLHRGEMTVLAARPGMGKTACVLNWLASCGVPALMFSLEMGAKEQTMRLISRAAKVDGQRLRGAKLTSGEWQDVAHATDRVAKLPLWIDDTCGIALPDLRAKVLRYAAHNGVQLVVVDYLQLMGVTAPKNANREQQVAALSRGLKQVAREANVAIVVLSQLNRAADTRSTNDKRPRLSDLRESGAIEQDADNVLFLYRPEYYKIMEFEDGQSTAGICEVLIEKQRNGPAGAAVRVHYNPAYNLFEDIAELPLWQSAKAVEPVQPSTYLYKDELGMDFV